MIELLIIIVEGVAEAGQADGYGHQRDDGENQPAAFGAAGGGIGDGMHDYSVSMQQDWQGRIPAVTGLHPDLSLRRDDQAPVACARDLSGRGWRHRRGR